MLAGRNYESSNMGHQRFGKLPATKKWREIVRFVANGEGSVGEIADRVFDACDRAFGNASKDPAFQEAIHLLCTIPLAASRDDFKAALAEIGIEIPNNPSRTDILVGYEKAIEKAQRSASKDITDLSEMAKQAGIAALNSLLVKPAPAPQLGFWEAPKEGVHLALSEYATPEGFGDLAQAFFTSLGKNNIRYFLDRELPKHLGREGFAKSIQDMILFDQNNERHNAETSVIMRPFAETWYAKKRYQERKKLTRKDLTGFAHVAIEKMRKEYRIRNKKDAAV